MSLVIHWGWRALSSRLGLGFVLCALLFLWHLNDKSQAVANARDGFVQEFKLVAAEAELSLLKKRVMVAETANVNLQEKMQVAEGAALRFSAELEAYEHATEVNPDGLVDGDLMRLLRSN